MAEYNLTGDDIELLNGKFGEVKTVIKEEVDTLHGRINELNDTTRERETTCRKEVDQTINGCERCIQKNKRETAKLGERTRILMWGFTLIAGGIVIGSITLAYFVLRGG